MIDREKFELIKAKYGHYASWAVWSAEEALPKSNIGDLTVLDPDVNTNLLSELHTDVVFVGLNISRGLVQHPLANFHDSRSEATDFKIRYGFRDSPSWGGYMTDIIKDFEEKISGTVEQYLKTDTEFEKQNIKTFLGELDDLGAVQPTLVAFGQVTYRILHRHFLGQYDIVKVPHYAHFISKENYRKEVRAILNLTG